MFLHHLQKFNDDLGRWSDQHLPLAPLFGICDALEAVVKNADKHHYLEGKEKARKDYKKAEKN